MFPSSGESTRQSQFKIGGECTWYALIASSRKTKRAKHPARHSLLARFQGLGITISSTWPNGSRSAFTAYCQYNPLIQKEVTASSILPFSLETYNVLLTLARSTRIIRPSRQAF